MEGTVSFKERTVSQAWLSC